MRNTKKIVTKLWILLVILTVGFSSICFLPKQKAMVPSQLSQDLPERLGGWMSKKRVVGERELQVLAEDTDFARRLYYTDALEGFRGVEVSVVFSGKDINNSLHRPEVCMISQGWNFVEQSSVILPTVLPEAGGLPVRKLVCVRPRVKTDGVEPPKNKDGDPVYDTCIQYYTFFGADSIVSGHYDRTFEDIRARLFGGYDQQWAYATFTVYPNSGYVDQGFEIPSELVYDNEASLKILHDFMKDFVPRALKAK